MRKNVLSRGSVSVIICFSFSHAVFHFLGQGFSVLIPSIQQTFNITPIEIGALITVREITAGFISLPGGLLSDYLKKHRSLILTFCLALYGIGWLIIGLSPLFSLLFLGMCVIASATSVWHLPAMTELGSRFPGEKGMVFAIFGAGGSVGDILGPVVTGLLLAYLSWQNIVTGYVILPFIMALWTYLMFQNVRKQDASDFGETQKHKPVSFRAQLKLTAEVIRDTDIFKINIVSGLRGMCFAVLVTFLPLYMHDSGFSGRSIGFHFGLLWAIGLVVSPYAGHLSDRFGRKIVLVPTLLFSGVLVAMLALWGEGWRFTALIALLGLSIRSDYSLISATIIDIVKQRAESTMLGILSFSRFLMGAIAPLIAGGLYQYVGMWATLLFVSVLFLIGAAVFASVDLHKNTATAE